MVMFMLFQPKSGEWRSVAWWRLIGDDRHVAMKGWRAGAKAKDSHSTKRIFVL